MGEKRGNHIPHVAKKIEALLKRGEGIREECFK